MKLHLSWLVTFSSVVFQLLVWAALVSKLVTWIGFFEDILFVFIGACLRHLDLCFRIRFMLKRLRLLYIYEDWISLWNFLLHDLIILVYFLWLIHWKIWPHAGTRCTLWDFRHALFFNRNNGDLRTLLRSEMNHKWRLLLNFLTHWHLLAPVV